MTAQNESASAHEHPVTITVNRKEVSLPDHKTSGLQIKEAAIAQGVPNIALDFDLFRVTGSTQHPVADDQKLTVHDREEFRMLRPDHAS